MPNQKKLRILFILSDVSDKQNSLMQLLPEICNALVKNHHDIYFMYPPDIEEEFELNMRKVPWIHAYKTSLAGSFSLQKLLLPFTIRQYIKLNDGIDVIHSFGQMSGAMSIIGSLGLNIINVNTPDSMSQNTAEESSTEIARQLLSNNLSFMLNRLYKKVILTHHEKALKLETHIIYKNITPAILDVTKAPLEVANNLIKIYFDAIASKNI